MQLRHASLHTQAWSPAPRYTGPARAATVSHEPCAARPRRTRGARPASSAGAAPARAAGISTAHIGLLSPAAEQRAGVWSLHLRPQVLHLRLKGDHVVADGTCHRRPRPPLAAAISLSFTVPGCDLCATKAVRSPQCTVWTVLYFCWTQFCSSQTLECLLNPAFHPGQTYFI